MVSFSWRTSAKTPTADLSVDTIAIVFIEKLLFQFHSLSVRRQSKIIAMERLHGIPASATTTKNGLFLYCGNRLSCQFFCPHKDRNIFARAVASFQASGCPQPIPVIKDDSKGNDRRPIFVCSDRNNP